MDWTTAIKGFENYLRLERSVSINTLDAYQRDLQKLRSYLDLKELEISPLTLELQHLEGFLRYIGELGLSKRSQARIISGIKAFYRFMLLEDLIRKDPTELLEAPKLDRDIPDVLTYGEIQRMLATIDLSTDHGQRTRALLEVLYASGLRVSELINLRITDLYLDVGFIRVLGKGDKERLVPTGSEAIKHLGFYLDHIRPKVPVKPDAENLVFLNRRGSGLSRVMVFKIIKQAAKEGGIHKKVSPHTFRHSFATHLIEGGADLRAVQDMLVHDSILTTEIYTHLNTDFLRETMLSFHPRSKNTKNDGTLWCGKVSL